MTTTPDARSTDPRLRAALRVTLAAAALFAAVAMLASGARAAVSVAAGGVIGAGNLYVLIRLVRAVFGRSADESGAGSGAALGVATVLKMFALYGGVYFLATSGLVGVFPLMVGLAALPIGIASAAFVSDRTA